MGAAPHLHLYAPAEKARGATASRHKINASIVRFAAIRSAVSKPSVKRLNTGSSRSSAAGPSPRLRIRFVRVRCAAHKHSYESALCLRAKPSASWNSFSASGSAWGHGNASGTRCFATLLSRLRRRFFRAMNLLKHSVCGLNCFFTPMSKVQDSYTVTKRLPYFRVRALYKRPRSLPYRESAVQITSHSRGKSSTICKAIGKNTGGSSRPKDVKPVHARPF